VDEYLAFCERALVGPANGKRLLLQVQVRGADKTADIMERYFPLAATASETDQSGRAGESVRQELRATEVAEEDVMRPGQGYTLSNGGEMPEEYGNIVRRAAGWVGVDAEYVRAVVESYERRLWRYWQRARRGGEVDEMTLSE
jgi:RNA polymerase I-specific transcription initiation factor RRN7